jgi:hypothetical protein
MELFLLQASGFCWMLGCMGPREEMIGVPDRATLRFHPGQSDSCNQASCCPLRDIKPIYLSARICLGAAQIAPCPHISQACGSEAGLVRWYV